MLGIFKNMIKNDYIYEIEKVLEKKNVTNEIKSLIMDTLFKIEETYPNYKRVKVDVLEKGEYISQIIYALKKIDKIEIMKMEEKDILKCVTKTSISINDNKFYNIKIYQNNLSLLYAIQMIVNREYGINLVPCSDTFSRILEFRWGIFRYRNIKRFYELELE